MLRSPPARLVWLHVWPLSGLACLAGWLAGLSDALAGWQGACRLVWRGAGQADGEQAGLRGGWEAKTGRAGKADLSVSRLGAETHPQAHTRLPQSIFAHTTQA